MNDRYLMVTTHECGCITAFDTLFWRPKPLNVCIGHMQAQINIQLAMLFVIEEVFDA
jgi:hypothetical protein